MNIREKLDAEYKAFAEKQAAYKAEQANIALARKIKIEESKALLNSAFSKFDNRMNKAVEKMIEGI